MDAKTKRDHSIPFPSQTTTATWYYCITLARFPFISCIVSIAAEIQNRYYKTDGTTSIAAEIQNRYYKTDGTTNIILRGHTQFFSFR